MLGITVMKGARSGDYYLNLACEDYYLKGGEPKGVWRGKGAEQLYLRGEEVGDHDLISLLNGFHPDGKKLTQNAGKEDRKAGWDLTFSAPKSVSVLWSQADPETREAIQEAHSEAIDKALEYLGDECAFTRRGKGGVVSEKVDPLIATFEHGTSRAQDPNLHTHCLLMNIGYRADGTTGTLETQKLYEAKMTMGALYRAEMCCLLEQKPELGFQTERVRNEFEVVGVNKNLCQHFSKRRQEIEEELKRVGRTGALASQDAALHTRTKKDLVPRNELFSDWHKKGKEYGFGTREIEEIRVLKREVVPENELQDALLATATEKLTWGQSHFTNNELVRELAVAAQGTGFGADKVHEIARTRDTHEQFVCLGRFGGDIRYTTKEVLAREEKMLLEVKSLSERGSGGREYTKTREEVLSTYPTMSDEQREAVTYITSGEQVQVVRGMAGTGKSFMLGAAKEVLEKEGREVLGCALSGKAAEGLEESAGIKSQTIHSLIGEIQSGRRSFSSSTTLIVDEAAMVSTRQMADLVGAIKESRGQLVLVGDERQLQAVEQGGAFKAIAKEVGYRDLTEIRRQSEGWAREAVSSMARGDTTQALEAYALRGLLSVSETQDEVREALISEWSKEGGVTEPEKHLILAGTNGAVRALNYEAQAARIQSDALGEQSVVAQEPIYERDRVLFTRNSRQYGVKNGSLGTVLEINTQKNELKAQLDNGREVQIPLNDYEHVRLGYAVTTHKAQGMTAENTYIQLGGGMQDRELSYVQLSRAKGTARMYTDTHEAGEGISKLAFKMSKSRKKELAHEIRERAVEYGLKEPTDSVSPVKQKRELEHDRDDGRWER